MSTLAEESGTKNKATRHFFVDEAGDPVLFNSRGTVIVGKEGVSRFFMVGFALIHDSNRVFENLDSLRNDLLADPYFRSVPSFQPGRKKTAICFHARNDLPEVRERVFRLLRESEFSVQAVIRRKEVVAEEALRRRREGMKLSGNDLYDDLVKRLFKNVLHQADENHLTFARRGNRPRQDALEASIWKAKRNFEKTWNKGIDKPTYINSGYPHEFGGLQVIDYALWALQRFYEKGEARFFDFLVEKYSLVVDLDDKRENKYGVFYNKKNLLTRKKIMPV